jgi:hypothetical protein
MANVQITNVVPKNLEWWGIGKELSSGLPSPGTITVPSMTIPLNSGAPNDAASMLVDKALRGDMGEDYNEVVGTLLADFPLAGNVYVDSIGHLLLNLFGDYTTTTPSATTSVTGSSGGYSVGSTAITGASMPIVPAGSYLVVSGPAGVSEVVVTGAIGTATNIPLLNPLRFTHTAPTISYVTTPANAVFQHKFALLNGSGNNGASSLGLNAQAQPVTHTITYFNALQANGTLNAGYTGYRQYAYWACSGMDFAMNTSNLFQHQTKGTSYFGQDNTNATGIANSQSDAGALPDWRFQVALGSGASIATSAGIINNIEQASISKTRQLVPKFALANQQAPVTIARLGLSAMGKLTWLAQDETPLLQMLAGTQQPLEIGMNNGVGTWAAPVAGSQSILFHFSRAQFEAAQLSDPDILAYDVGFRALMNTTDIGVSGARGPMTVTLTNAVPTY